MSNACLEIAHQLHLLGHDYSIQIFLSEKLFTIIIHVQ